MWHPGIPVPGHIAAEDVVATLTGGPVITAGRHHCQMGDIASSRLDAAMTTLRFCSPQFPGPAAHACWLADVYISSDEGRL